MQNLDYFLDKRKIEKVSKWYPTIKTLMPDWGWLWWRKCWFVNISLVGVGATVLPWGETRCCLVTEEPEVPVVFITASVVQTSLRVNIIQEKWRLLLFINNLLSSLYLPGLAQGSLVITEEVFLCLQNTCLDWSGSDWIVVEERLELWKLLK